MSRKTLLVALVVALVSVCVCVARQGGPDPRFVAGPPQTERVEVSAASAPTAPPPVEVLRTWDAHRAEAWARGDMRLLSTLYTRDSVAGQHDRAMLRTWLARGLVVRGMQTQLLEVREVRRTASIWTLIVTDRLVGGLAVGAGVRRPLPRDAPTTRTVEFRRVSGGWSVSAVEPLDAGP